MDITTVPVQVLPGLIVALQVASVSYQRLEVMPLHLLWGMWGVTVNSLRPANVIRDSWEGAYLTQGL